MSSFAAARGYGLPLPTAMPQAILACALLREGGVASQSWLIYCLEVADTFCAQYWETASFFSVSVGMDGMHQLC